MADIVVTAGNVVKGTGSLTRSGIAGAAITAGQVVYLDAADANKIKVVDSDSVTVAARVPAGIALNSASVGQPVTYQYDGLITIGGTVEVGRIYVASDNAGGIMPAADLEAGDFTSILGIGVSATQIDLQLHHGGVAYA